MLTVRVKINIASQTTPQIIPVVQGDTGRSILFEIADFVIPAQAIATYFIKKPSGHAVYNSATIDRNTVLANLTAQSIAEVGENPGQVRIIKNDEVVTSFDFILDVEPFRGIDAIESTTEMNIFDKAVQQALEEIDGSLDSIVADEFSTSDSYLDGEYVLKDGVLYRFTADHAAGAWSTSDTEAITVGEALEELAGGGGGGGAVNSVNGKTGTVVLDAGDLEYDDEETYAAGSVGATLTAHKEDLNDVEGLIFKSSKLTPTTESHRYLVSSSLLVRSWSVSSIAYFPIVEERFINKKFVVKSDIPLQYLGIAVFDAFPSYGVSGTEGTIINNTTAVGGDGTAIVNELSITGTPSSKFVVITYLTTDESHVTLSVLYDNLGPKTYKVEKDGSGNFTKLSDAINVATQYMDSTVYVGAGTWDLIEELGSEYIESVGINKRGLYLKNRVHLIFASNSKVTCNYAGTTASVRTWLSAFNAGEYGFTLENCRLEASNCRYAVHDERDSDADQYTNVYRNCSMYMDNSANTETTAHQCIGGGLGVNGHIVIENCDFESVNTRAVPSVYTPVSYHNSAGAGLNRVDISGVYMVNGTVRLNWYGASTEKTPCYVHDCSFTHDVLSFAETSGATNENIVVKKWNNEIRL